MAVSLWAYRLAPLIHRNVAASATKVVLRRNCSSNENVDEKRVTVARRKDSFVMESDAVKDKKVFMDMIEKFKVANPNRRGHVEFINVALTKVEEFQVSNGSRLYTV